jgi:hypothetical protein
MPRCGFQVGLAATLQQQIVLGLVSMWRRSSAAISEIVES